MNNLIADNKQNLIKLCKKYDIQTMYVFGSVNTDQFHETSDLDFLISFKEIPIEKYTDNYFLLHKELERIFERKIDLVTERSLSNPFFIESVEMTKQLLYAA